MASLHPARRLFLKWALVNALAVVFLGGLAAVYHDRASGAPLIAIPIILLLAIYASAFAGKLCWKAEGIEPGSAPANRIVHEARYITFWSWVCQMVGILSTVVGFWIILSGGDETNLAARIQEGGGVALLSTFVGVFSSLVLSLEQRMIEHDLES